MSKPTCEIVGTEGAYHLARRWEPWIQDLVHDAFERCPPAQPIWRERGHWEGFTPSELAAAINRLRDERRPS